MQGFPDQGLGEPVPPIIIKKVIKKPGLHRGAWKVAFADFVTAMMALFMVLWLMGADQSKQKAIAGYFQDPDGFQEALRQASGEREADLSEIADSIHQALLRSPEFEGLKDQVSIQVTPDGLRIELLESDKATFFASGSPVPTLFGNNTLGVIGDELSTLPNRIIIEGHTDSKRFRGRQDYSNWELSVDRANLARRILLENGIKQERIVEVRGFADVRLRKPEDPENASNRRISLIVKYGERSGL